MFIWSSQFNISYGTNVTASAQDCLGFYTNVLSWGGSATSLCNDSLFNFTKMTDNIDYFHSTLALTSIYLYHD